MSSVSLDQRFWSKVDKNGPVFIDGDGVDRGPCWLWTAATNDGGYGLFRYNGKMQMAHCLSTEEVYGPCPAGLESDHRCRRHNCVNPLHIERVTKLVNLARRVFTPHLNVNARKTCCPRGHPYDAENTYYRPNGKRECRACGRAARVADEIG